MVPHSPQTLILSSGSTTSLGPKAPAAYRTWCLTPRKTLFFRPQAPLLSGQRRRRRTGRGASLPANTYSFVRKHHVPRSGWTDAGTDVVLHSPQNLISPFPLHQVFVPFRNSNPSDLVQRLPAKPYFSVSFAPSLCPFSELQPFGLGAKTPAKPYSFVSFAPSLWPFSELQPLELGAKTPAKPCSFVSFAPSLWPFSELQPLGLGAKTLAKTYFSVSFAPSPQPKMNLRRYSRGAPYPAIPYSFVEGHHVLAPGWDWKRKCGRICHSTALPSTSILYRQKK